MFLSPGHMFSHFPLWSFGPESVTSFFFLRIVFLRQCTAAEPRGDLTWKTLFSRQKLPELEPNDKRRRDERVWVLKVSFYLFSPGQWFSFKWKLWQFGLPWRWSSWSTCSFKVKVNYLLANVFKNIFLHSFCSGANSFSPFLDNTLVPQFGYKCYQSWNWSD